MDREVPLVRGLRSRGACRGEDSSQQLTASSGPVLSLVVVDSADFTEW